ncbi:MAG: ATP-binding protein [Bryobacterales bacterium]|nr:ATP-binding protein [Bryobacterales bacterium]
MAEKAEKSTTAQTKSAPPPKAAVPQRTAGVRWPVDPLDRVTGTSDAEFRRRTIEGILQSYHSNYDVPAEALQNAVDAVEDAKLTGLPAPYSIEVTVNMTDNWLGVLDTGIGMSFDEVTSAFAPNVSFKSAGKSKRERKNMYRGYKGVGLTFLAYGTDDITIHSKQSHGELVKARMRYGRSWAEGNRSQSAVMVEDTDPSPLDGRGRGTYIKVQFSPSTRPKNLAKLAQSAWIWRVILRTRTAVGQVSLGRDVICPIKTKLHVIEDGRKTTTDVDTSFLYPHEVKRSPAYRFLDLPKYYQTHAEQSAPPADKLRQDGIYLVWDTERIKKELTSDQQVQFAEELKTYSPYLYAFVPYQGSVWGELNQIATGVKNRNYLYPGLMLAVNRQRLADIFEIGASRYETFSRNVFVIMHFDDAKPDQGRKTLEVEAFELAQRTADRVVQYFAKQRELLRPPGESPTPEQRQVEKNHSDWEFNVRTHASHSPLHIPPTTYISTPLTEQDVVGLFHQLSTLGVFSGIRVYATSQSKTYDCLIEFDCPIDQPGLRYVASDQNPLGVSPYTLGTHKKFSTRQLTLEFKNNLDRLIADVEGDSPKTFGDIDVCVCWSKVSDTFKGYELSEITEANLDERQYPGVTHLLRRDGDVHVVKVIMLEKVVQIIQAGKLSIPVM